MGQIRIGTLHDFRRSEHKMGISDPKEGTKRVSHYIENLDHTGEFISGTNQGIDADSLEKMGLTIIGDKTRTIINKSTFGRVFSEPDCFILCSSLYKSKETMAEFEGADSCLHVNSLSLFFRLITEVLNLVTPVQFIGLRAVNYQDREEPWNGKDWGRHPALIKETIFKPQGEVRAIWKPMTSEAISPIITNHYRLSECITPIDFT